MESFNKNWLVILLVAIVFGLLGYLLGKTSHSIYPFPHFDKHKVMMFGDKDAIHDDISVDVDVEKIIDGIDFKGIDKDSSKVVVIKKIIK
jgi:hypothetical protein